MIDFYVHQTKGFNLGNFVMCTPAITSLHTHYNKPIPMVFNTPYLENMYRDWDAIEIITQAEATNRRLRRLFSTSLTNTVIEDYKFIHNTVCGMKGIKTDEVPWTYAPKLTQSGQSEYVVIIRGCLPGGSWADHKFIPDEYYKHCLDNIDMTIKFIGSTNDYNEYLSDLIEYAKKSNKVEVILDDTDQILREINGAKYIVSNDTGWYHIAGALDKPIFCMWKDTPYTKNLVPGDNCTYSRKGDWMNDFDTYIKGEIDVK